MKAGRGLDMLIAEKVFERDPMLARHGLEHGEPEYHWGYPHGHSRADYYSANMGAAMKVVEYLLGDWDEADWKPEFTLTRYDDGAWVAHFGSKYEFGEPAYWLHGAYAQTPQMAICLAAFKVKGIEIE